MTWLLRIYDLVNYCLNILIAQRNLSYILANGKTEHSAQWRLHHRHLQPRSVTVISSPAFRTLYSDSSCSGYREKLQHASTRETRDRRQPEDPRSTKNPSGQKELGAYVGSPSVPR